MKRILLLCLTAAMAFTMGELRAQDRVINGHVTAADDGAMLPGVNVVIKGTTTGTVTDAEGTYSLSIPASSGSVLVFSFIGLQTQEIETANHSVVDVTMIMDASQLSEVVVTALGIERAKNELPFAAQQVKGEDITQARGVNFVTALSGRVAGLDVKTSNTMGGSTNVVIRGYKSITGSNQALFVIDGVPVSNANTNTTDQASGRAGVDYGNAAADINPDNIASINVLKGAMATALYGSRGANGVIMITTKKGKHNSMDVTINSGVSWGSINKSTFPTYQTEYGGGYTGVFNKTSPSFDDGPLNATAFTDDASYGPKFDPSLNVYQWDALDPFSPNYHKGTPWVAAKNGPITFFKTALTSNQSIFVSGGGDKSTFKFGYTRNDETGILPNSKLRKNLFNLTATFDLTKKLKLTTSANFSNIEGIGRYSTGYNGQNAVRNFRQWWQVNTDLKDQKEAYFRNSKNVTWNWANLQGTNPIYADNPYWTRYQNYSNDTRNHIFGYTTVNYQATTWLEVVGRVGFDQTSDLQEERIAIGSASTPSYTRFNRNFNETNFDFFLNFNKNITRDITFRAVLGSSARRTKLTSIRASTSSGLVVPNLYALSNSVGSLTGAPAGAQALLPPIEEYTRVGVDGLFANATFGYKELLFLDVAMRRDQSTTLPRSNNVYPYPSAGLSFVYSNIIKKTWLTNGKLRVNYADVGNDAPALSVYNVYDKAANFGSTPLFSLPNTKNNQALKSEKTRSYEAGIEADFFDGRVGFDFTAYQTNTFNQILPVTVTAATGYTSSYVNAGDIRNRGIELSAFVVPLKTSSFSWTMNINFTRNRNKVLSLYGQGSGEVTNIPIISPQGGVTINAAKNQPYGVIRGYDYVYTNGEKTVGPNGYYLRSATANEIIGNPNPDWLGGVNNTFKYKGLSFNFLVDVRHGGDIFSLDQWYGEATGLYKNSAGLNELGNPSRLTVAEGGGILLPGVQADGSPNTVRAENTDGNSKTPFGYAAGGKGAPHKMYVYDGSFIKLREVALTYTVPHAIVAKLRAFKTVSISLIGRNLWIIKKNMKYSDPEESLSSGNANSGYQSGAYPAVKNYGFNLKLNF